MTELNFHVVKIGRVILLALPEYNWVTLIFPYPFEGTKQISGTIDYMIDMVEQHIKERNKEGCHKQSKDKNDVIFVDK